MVNLIPSFLDYIHENIDPAYAERKKEVKKSIQAAGLISTAALVASIVFGVLGIALTTSAGVAVIFGLPIILVSLPVGYLSYNSYKTLENIKDVLENPKKYQNSFGLEDSFDKQSLKNKLTQGTFCFSWCIGFILEEMFKSGTLKERSFD